MWRMKPTSVRIYYAFIVVFGILLTQILANFASSNEVETSNLIAKPQLQLQQPSLHIEIRRKRSIQFNGIEIDENSLLSHLAAHERELIFGKNGAPRTLKLVHLSHRTDVAGIVDDDDDDDDNDDHEDNLHSAIIDQRKQEWHNKRRIRRAATDRKNSEEREDEFVSVKIQDDEHFVKLKLQQTPKLIDDAFIFIKRNANHTQFIEDSHKLIEKYEGCFYRSENSALDLCDEASVRGVYKHNSSDFIIQPLPGRFGNNTHVIYEAQQQEKVDRVTAPAMQTTFESNLQFEPDEEEFNISPLTTTNQEEDEGEAEAEEPSTRPTRDIRHHHNHHQHHHDDASSGNLSKVVTPHRPQQRNGDQKSQQLHLNLRFKPRYHQQQQQQQQHKEHHYYHKHHRHQRQHQHQHQHHRQHQNQQTHPKHHHNNKKNHHNQQHASHNHHYHHHQQQQQEQQQQQQQEPELSSPPQLGRTRRHIAASNSYRKLPEELHIETAIFVDSDLYRHMEKNFPKDTESHLIRFVLAMINGVQLLYHHATLGRRINFVLKRLEIFKKDPPDLRRSSDIDTYLSNFCEWQKSFNPLSDADPIHFDHAVILTGLDLYVVGKNGKVISQVVGLAPVAGMCTATSSCTINEGKHFESVFVVAHEIGHNLGMRHDTNEINCDPTLHIMSPTLGSGKITWSKCSRTFLNEFLETTQSHCLLDRGQFKAHLDHSAEGMLPGERFDANQQCMLKYGRNSVRAPTQSKAEICRDLHCQRDRYTWTSHPALEGTECGDSMWCRSGVCVRRPAMPESKHGASKHLNSLSKNNYDKSNFVEASKMGQLLHEYNYNKIGDHGHSATWSDWGEASACDSGCLYGTSKRLSEGSTGLRTYERDCLIYPHRCAGPNRRYESCFAQQCARSTVPMQTIEDFATGVCKKTQNLDMELTGEGLQIVGDYEESCKVFCKTKSNSTKSRRWIFPDGTTCHSKHYAPNDVAYCIAGRCERFSCDNSTKNYYKIASNYCQERSPADAQQANSIEMESKHYNSYYNNYNHNKNYNNYKYNVINRRYNERGESGGIYGPTTVRSRYENEVAIRRSHDQERRDGSVAPQKRKAEPYLSWYKYKYPLNEPQQVSIVVPDAPRPLHPPVSAPLIVTSSTESEWLVKSGCHSSCMAKSKGIQVVSSRLTGANNIQLCTHHAKPCERLLSASEYAENTCARYKLKVRGLSGHGTQIAASIDEPDRSCRVGCQDEYIKYRYYLVNGKYGHFPLGTKCSNTEERYCVNGKCLEFGPNNIPLQQSHISLALFRSRREAPLIEKKDHMQRSKRSFLFYDPVNITETITQEFLNNIVNSIIDFESKHLGGDESTITDENIEFNNPIHISMDELNPN